MSDPFFFGYGSLVNRGTHDYPQVAQARIRGWRRRWRHTTLRQVAFLTAVPDAAAEIEGVIAAVPGSDWAALDLRERAYARHAVPDTHADHALPQTADIQVYAIPEGLDAAPDAAHPILLSYIDTVIQGFLHEFGEDGARRFVETTDGWDAPILNDRAAPIYPRHQALQRHERALVDDLLAGLPAVMQDLE